MPTICAFISPPKSALDWQFIKLVTVGGCLAESIWTPETMLDLPCTYAYFILFHVFFHMQLTEGWRPKSLCFFCQTRGRYSLVFCYKISWSDSFHPNPVDVSWQISMAYAIQIIHQILRGSPRRALVDPLPGCESWSLSGAGNGEGTQTG